MAEKNISLILLVLLLTVNKVVSIGLNDVPKPIEIKLEGHQVYSLTPPYTICEILPETKSQYSLNG